VTVSRMVVYVVEVQDAYDPVRYDVLNSEPDARARAEAVMAQPDSRGQYREWKVDDGRPHGDPPAGPAVSFNRLR